MPVSPTGQLDWAVYSRAHQMHTGSCDSCGLVSESYTYDWTGLALVVQNIEQRTDQTYTYYILTELILLVSHYQYTN